MCIWTRVQPAGALTVEDPRVSIEARSTSPATTPAGLARLMVLTDSLWFEPYVTERRAMPVPAGTSVQQVQLNVLVASTVAPSRTVMPTAYGLALEPVAPMVPVIRPVAALIERPGGRFVAAYVSASPSGSVAPASRLTRVPSGLVRVGQVLVEGGLADWVPARRSPSS